jgi:Ca2+-binding RTX toxin-like protein
MEVRRGTPHADTLAGSGDEAFQLVGLRGNDSYTLRLFDYVRYPPDIGTDTGEPETVYVRDKVVEAADGGNDTVRLTVAYNPVEFTGIYPTGIVSAAELANIETVTLFSYGRSTWDVSTDNFANTVRGSTVTDVVHGNGGDDSLYGRGGADQLFGGLGRDSLYGDAGDDILTDTDGANRLAGGDGRDRLTSGAARDELYGDAGNDTLDGGQNVDRLEGGAGNDVLIGGVGPDQLFGGTGVDTASYAGATHGVVVHLAAPSKNTYDAKGDTYTSIENLVGSKYGDTLTGDARANLLDGAAGADTLLGGVGNDELRGGAGVDRLDGGSGDDLLFLVAGQGADYAVGGAGRDVFDFTLSTDHEGAFGTIADVRHGVDVIRMHGINDLVASLEQVGDAVVVTVGNVLDLGGFGTVFNAYGSIRLLHADVDEITRADLGGTPIYHDDLM